MSSLSTFFDSVIKDCGANCVQRSPEICSDYAMDRSSEEPVCPQAVLIPSSEADIQSMLKHATALSIPITVRGAGSGKTGGAIPDTEGLVLSMENFDQIIEIDTETQTARVQANVLTKTLQEAVIQKGLYYPPDPASADYCSIGGNVAENAGGPSCYKYGVTKDYILGMKGVYATGELFEFGGAIRKNVAGFDLISLLIGSEGTLAVITEITCKLLPYPSYRETLFLNFQDYQGAVTFLSDIAKAGVFPKSAEFLEDRIISALEAYHSDVFPFSVSPAMIMMDCESYDETQLQYECQTCEDLAVQYNAKSQRMKTTVEQDQLWEYRRTISMALTQMGGEKFSEDIVVPISQLETCIKELNDIATFHNVVIIGYGHLGDGNIHVNCLKMDLSDSEWQAVKAKVIEKLLRLAVSLGGSITGEHGVGLSKKEHMNLMFTEKDLHIHRELKKVWDPSGILNPGKMIE